MKDSHLSRSQLAYQSLKCLIRDRALAPGHRVREADVAERLGVSRTPVREAIHRLISEGLLSVNPVRGFVVPEVDRQQVVEIYGLREFLEGASARFAAQHASGAELASLRALLEDSRKIPGGEADRHAAFNTNFHTRIAEAAHNRYLLRTLRLLSDFLVLVPGTTFEIAGRAEQAYHEHLAIVEAMEARAADAAEAAARLHIRKAGEARLTLLFGRF